jgi:hypothetical protein
MMTIFDGKTGDPDDENYPNNMDTKDLSPLRTDSVNPRRHGLECE